MATVGDEDLKKAFAELHDVIIDTKQKLKLSDIQIETLKRGKQRAELTEKEIKALPENTRTFESVGRMFLLQDIDTIKEDLKKRMASSDEKVKGLENRKLYLQRNLKEVEDNIREMVQRRQQQ